MKGGIHKWIVDYLKELKILASFDKPIFIYIYFF
jgi:hypothetical protein